MSSKFNKFFNKYADAANSMNRGINKIIGKDVLKDMKKIEEPRDFPPYESFPSYTEPEPEQWTPLTGNAKQFKLFGNVIEVSANLDACIQYRKIFNETARYYTDRFIFKYRNCVKDFDTFVNYFEDMYFEGLFPLIDRAYSVLLTFGIFNANGENFLDKHMNAYRKAINTYATVSGIETEKNKRADDVGNSIGNSIQMSGFGFGVKGAMKGMAKAEAFNLGMNLLGKFVAQQNQMTQEDKAKVFSNFKEDIFFKEVYSDYCNTFMTMVQILSDNNKLGKVTTRTSDKFYSMLENLINPMFPQNQIAPTLVELISVNPFEKTSFDILKQKFGATDEITELIKYFNE